jgi:hypothetical protein
MNLGEVFSIRPTAPSFDFFHANLGHPAKGWAPSLGLGVFPLYLYDLPNTSGVGLALLYAGDSEPVLADPFGL